MCIIIVILLHFLSKNGLNIEVIKIPEDIPHEKAYILIARNGLNLILKTHTAEFLMNKILSQKINMLLYMVGW